MMKQLFFLYPVFFLWLCPFAVAQSYSLQVSIKNQPDNPVVLGTIRGDKFTPVDTLVLQEVALGHLPNQLKKVNWQFPVNATPGMYRLVLGQTTYARVMGESPQQLDFVFNNENIILETDFKAPQESLVVVLSDENRVWFDFLKKEKDNTRHLEFHEEVNQNTTWRLIQKPYINILYQSQRLL